MKWQFREDQDSNGESNVCSAKLMEKKRTENLMVQMAKANGVRWYGHVLRRDDGK